MLTRSDSCRSFDKMLTKSGIPGFTMYSPNIILTGRYFHIGGGSWTPQALGATETEARDTIETMVERARLEAISKQEHSAQEKAKAESRALLAKNLGIEPKKKLEVEGEEDEEEIEVLEEAKEADAI